MTQIVLDIATGLRRLLAEWPCECPKHKLPDFHHCPRCEDTNCALLWASSACDFVSYTTDGVQHTVACKCNGSGRVPKEFGLETLFEHGLTFIQYQPIFERREWAAKADGVWGYGETPMLAALRAVAQAGMLP